MKSTVNNHLLRAAMMLLVLLFTSATASAQTVYVDESEVTILPAIKSTGAQAFNTGFVHTLYTRVEMDCEVTKNSQRDWEALFGGRLSDFTKNAFCFFTRHKKNSSTAKDEPCFNRTGVETTGSNFVYGERIKLVCDGQEAKWYRYTKPGTLVGSVTTTGTANEGKTPMFLFDLNTSSVANGLKNDGSFSVMTLYGCEIYDNNRLVRSFTPARYKGKVGLYDRVNHTFGESITDIPFDPVEPATYTLTSSTTVLENGCTYNVTSNVTVSSRIRVNGVATLNLGEGATLTAQKGIEVGCQSSLTINGPGSLKATADEYFPAIGGYGDNQQEYGNIIINGGNITATGGRWGAGIGGGKSNVTWSNKSFITINGGVIKATGGNGGAGIGGGYRNWAGDAYGMPGVITINGGQVTATGGSSGAPGIGKGANATGTEGSLTLGWTNATDFIYASSYNINSISFAKDKTFVLDGTDTEATTTNIGGKKIVPKNAFVKYELYVGSTQVTSENQDDVLGDGTISYVPGDGTGTLTVKTKTPNLPTDAVRFVSATGINLTIDAPYGLDLSNYKSFEYAISAFNGSLTINGDVTGSAKSYLLYLPLEGSNLSVVGNVDISYGAMLVNGDVNIEGNLTINTQNSFPSCLEANSATIKGDVNFSGAKGVGIYIRMGTLTVEGNVTGSSDIIGIGVTDGIDIKGNVNVTSYSEQGASVVAYDGDIVITGDVDIDMPNGGYQGIQAENLTISGNVKISGGTTGILAMESVTMLSGRWDVSGNKYSIVAGSLTIPDTHRIVEPADGKFSDGCIVDANGNYVQHAIIVEASADAYIITVTSGKAYEYDGQFFLSGLTQIYAADAGKQVLVEPNVTRGQYVLRWDCNVNVDFVANGSSAIFTMPESNVVLTPVRASQYSYNIDVRRGNETTVEEDVFDALLATYKPNSVHFVVEKLDLDGDGTADLQLSLEGNYGSYTYKAKALEGTNLTGTYTVTEPNIYKYYPINVVFSGAGVPTWTGSGTEDDPYIISSASELDQLAQYVKGFEGIAPNTFTGKYFKLGCDITYNHETDWDNITSTENNYTSIGFKENYDTYVFNGHFDGDGHTISGIRIYRDDGFSCIGLFGNIGSEAEVKNVILADARITGAYSFGGIAGCSCGSVSNCHVTSTVTIHTDWEYSTNSGGIVGLNGDPSHSGVVTDCSCAAALTIAEGIQKNTRYGGIVGFNYNGILRRNLVVGATIPGTRNDLYYGYTHGAIFGYKYGYTALEHNYYRDCTVAGTANATNCGVGSINNGVAADVEDNDGAVPQRKGDVDLDGAATNKDVTAAVDQLVGGNRNRLTEVAADLNNDNEVDIKDVTAIIQKVVGE